MEADTAPVTTPIDPRTRKNPYRTPPKYPLGERGFSGAGTYPRIGPFEIQRQRPLRNREAQRDLR